MSWIRDSFIGMSQPDGWLALHELDTTGFNKILSWPSDVQDVPSGIGPLPTDQMALEILGIGCDATATLAIATRRPEIQLRDAEGTIVSRWAAGGTMTLGQSLRWDFAPGIAFATPLAGFLYRESLPLMVLHPGQQLVLGLFNGQSGDVATWQVRGRMLVRP